MTFILHTLLPMKKVSQSFRRSGSTIPIATTDLLSQEWEFSKESKIKNSTESMIVSSYQIFPKFSNNIKSSPLPFVSPETLVRKKDDSIRKALLDPPCFEQFKVPKVIGLASKRTQAFEKPLFDRASSIRNTLVPLSAALILLKTDPQTAEMTLTELLKDLMKEFQKVNYDRVIAVAPDPDVRKALSLPVSHALRDEDVLVDLKAAKKLAKTFEPKKPGKHRRGNRSQSERSSASRSSS